MASRKEYGDPLPGAFELFRPSWEAFKLNWQLFVLTYVVPIIVFSLLALIFLVPHWNALFHNETYHFRVIDGVTITILALIAIPIGAFINTATYALKLESAKGRRVDIGFALKKARQFFWRIFGLTVARFFIVIIGICLIVIPGLLAWRMLFLAPYYLMDRDLTIKQAMRQSAKASWPIAYTLWPMLGVYILIQIIGNIPLIGWLASIAGSIAYDCAAAIRYFQVKAAK